MWDVPKTPAPLPLNQPPTTDHHCAPPGTFHTGRLLGTIRFMDTESLKQLYFLKMRKACSDMEHANQCAARDTARGEWQCNWSEMHSDAAREFADAEAMLRANCFA